MKVYPWIGDPKIQKHYDISYDIGQIRSHKIMEKFLRKKQTNFFSLENGDDIDHVHTCIIEIKSIKRL